MHETSVGLLALLALWPVLGSAAGDVPAEAVELEEIVIGGSRIVREDYRSASPIVTVSEQLFEQTGAVTVETVLNSLPQFVPSITNTSNNPSNSGQANVELRGLGAERTLVLLDGRRIVPANGTGVVDLNLLPASVIGSVEITSGGASAVYGSDALAGVVNFRTRDFEGLEIESNWGRTTSGDGDAWQTSITAGSSFADGRTHGLLVLTYADREAVRQADREFTRVALGYDRDRGFVPLGSPTIEEGRVIVPASQQAFDALFVERYGAAPAGSPLQTAFGVNPDGSLFTTGDGSSGSVLNFRGPREAGFNDAAYTYNFAPPNYLQLPLERRSVYGRLNHQVDDRSELYGQIIWADYAADIQLAPTPVSAVSVPVTNPYLPADLALLAASRSDPGAPLPYSKRMSEIGPRIGQNRYEVGQGILGVAGELIGSWAYDVYAAFGRSQIETTQHGNVSRGRFEALAFAPDGGAAACGGFDPFRPGGMTAACLDYVTIVAANTQQINQTIFEAIVSGQAAELPAGPLQLAVGGFYKRDRYSYVPDAALSQILPDGRTDIVGFNGDAPTRGSAETRDLYAELTVPVLRDVPAARSLDLTLGYRHSDTTAGAAGSWKGTLSYEPSAMLRVRGSYQRAVRVPSILELYQPEVTTFPFIDPGDPCNVSSVARTGPQGAAVADLCLAHGLPAALLETYRNPNAQIEARTGGNPDLFEESADTASVGLVITSRLDGILADLLASIDYYSIEIENAIDVLSAQTFVARCYDPAFNPALAVDNFYCGRFERDPATGEIINARELQANIGAVRTDGIDVQFDWRFAAGPGQLSFNGLASRLLGYERQELPGDAFIEQRGTIGSEIAGAFPDWKAVLNVGYTVGGLGLNLRWRYIDDMVDRLYDGHATEFPSFRIPSVSYFDLTVGYGFDSGGFEGLTMRAGIVNLTDETPPLFPSAVQANTDPSTYDVLGRRYFVDLTYAF